MPMLKFITLAAFLVFTLPCAWAAPPDDVLAAGPSGVVATVIDGDTVRLKDGDADIRLIGLQAPKLPLGRKGFKAWPLADEAKAALKGFALNKDVRVRLGTSARDRHGRMLAHVVRADDVWVQAEMLRLGLARVYTFPDNRALAAEMLAIETEARRAKRGIWGHPFYAVRDALSPGLADDNGTFQIVRGTVTDAAKTKERVYLNFGADYRSDFTVSVEKRDWRMFEAAGIDLLAFKGKTIEARGWIVKRNGPMIEATHPEQISR
ncbi:MAG: thermonuclease family protein [Rhodospirillaceae bacterium]|nr:thermonuclease family protein [Rhodospirillaceae bacterium]